MTSLTLNRLGRRHSTEMIAAVAGGKPLPEEVLGQIWAKTEGVPLFVEELTKTVLESGLLEDGAIAMGWPARCRRSRSRRRLQDSLMARLDRLAPVKEVAQIGAVIGREFSYRLLAALSPLDETALQEALSHLVGAELVFRRGTIPDATYSFKHAFVQDAAYASLLKSKRQQLHAEVAGALRESFPEIADSQPRSSPTTDRRRPTERGDRLLAMRRAACRRALGRCRSGSASRQRPGPDQDATRER